MEYKEVLESVIAGDDLSSAEMTRLMDSLMEGALTPTQIAAILVALRIKGETIDEIAAAATSMRAHATAIDGGEGPITDIVGTGGDGHHTINISSCSMFVAAGAGVKIAKHGNRSVSSRCGSADVLKALGINIEAAPSTVTKCVQEIGIGFLFAPVLHGAMKYAIGPRRELGVRTLFNILGPLTNPAGATRLMIGVFKEELTGLYAQVLQKMGAEHAMIAYGQDGLDEISGTTISTVAELKDGEITRYELDPREYVGRCCEMADLRGDDADTNAKTLRAILSGEIDGAKRDVIVLNAAAGIYVSGRAPDYGAAIDLAKTSIDSGAALKKLDDLVAMSNS